VNYEEGFDVLPIPARNKTKYMPQLQIYTEDRRKNIQNRKTTKKFVQNQKPHTKPSKPDTMVTSGKYRVNYTNSNFMKVFVNVMELLKPSYLLVSLSVYRLSYSLFT